MSRLVVLAAIALLVAGCKKDSLNETGTSLSSRQINVVASTGLVADLVGRVGGGRVEIETLMAPGVDPHVYKATHVDVTALEDADAVFYNGLGLEAKLTAGLERLRGRARTFAVARGIDRRRLIRLRGPAGGYNPHVWLDVALWREVLAQVRDDLGSLDRANADIYRRNAARYDRQLAELDRWVRRRVAVVPARERVIAAPHGAFAYFGRAYGFEVRSDDSNGLRLLSDSLGKPGTPEAGYPGMVRQNVEAIVSGLL